MRKKMKPRNAPALSPAKKTETGLASPVNYSNSSKVNIKEHSYSKDHLDEWLETCLRDATNTQQSSSSEFLEFLPSTAAAHKHVFVRQQLLQHKKQQELQNPLQRYGISPSTPYSFGIQRHSHSLSHRYPMLFPPPSLNCHGISYGGDDSHDFASLPPQVNMMGGAEGAGSENDPNSADVLGASGSNPSFNKGFRFSEPCLLNPSDNDSKLSGQNTPDCRNGYYNDSGCDLAQQNKLFAALMEQINILHDTNSKICQNLHETKVDIEALKHTPGGQTWAGVGSGTMRHRRDSLSGLSTHSQPLVFGGGMGGTHSPASTFHSGAYTPGMMTDVVREVKEAARIREDALLSRVKAMVDERQWALHEGNVHILRDINELKSHIFQLRLEKNETNKRLSHLEAENKWLRQAISICYNQKQSFNNITYENERARGSPKPFPNGGGVDFVGTGALEVRRAQSLNLHYGTMHQTPSQTTRPLEEHDKIKEEQLQEQKEVESKDQPITQSKRLLCSSNEFRSNGILTLSKSIHHSRSSTSPQQSISSPPTFSLISDQDIPEYPQPPKRENAHIKRESSETAAARMEANQRLIALEKLVKNLSIQVNGQQNGNNNESGAASDATKLRLAKSVITDL
ncbi:uncharacterized protein LOC108114973 isoform X2 [Drosophila eugracilis]|nr:uncharacterized protein LOC108114973 isoform X2 [Drosophila eugracilis]